jgi:hypothetical protein
MSTLSKDSTIRLCRYTNQLIRISKTRLLGHEGPDEPALVTLVEEALDELARLQQLAAHLQDELQQARQRVAAAEEAREEALREVLRLMSLISILPPPKRPIDRYNIPYRSETLPTIPGTLAQLHWKNKWQVARRSGRDDDCCSPVAALLQRLHACCMLEVARGQRR